MAVSTRELEGGTVVVDLTGELDMASSPDVRKLLVDLVSNETPRILLSLEQTEYIDSSGLATFVECLQGVKRYGGQLRIYGVNDQIGEVFKLARLDAVFEICPDEATALAE